MRDLTCAFVHIPAAIHAHDLQLVEYDFRNLGEHMFGEIDTFETYIDWDTVCRTLRGTNLKQSSRTPLRIKVLFGASQEDNEGVKMLRRGLQNLENAAVVEFYFSDTEVVFLCVSSSIVR